MKILPSYLIEYMPYLEDAMEELRLSVYDHAYDMLKALDIDELSTDEIRQKLELYDIKVENMSESWSPNGRFYRIYPSIRYNRTRLNSLQSVVKSGGQFEGLWSDNFSGKTEFNYKYIQMLRHYQTDSPADGYFYISGDTSMTTSGVVTDSSVNALSSDILIDQAMPAGYTYLYIPWPEPHYKSNSECFYNVNSLLVDRIYYNSGSCEDNTWIVYDDETLYNASNHGPNQYYKISGPNKGKYGKDGTFDFITEDTRNDFPYDGILYEPWSENPVIPDGWTGWTSLGPSLPSYNENNHATNKYYIGTWYSDNPNSGFDYRFISEYYTDNQYSQEKPASTNYDYENGTNTPYRLPYWIDYHYIGNTEYTDPIYESNGTLSYAGTWPVAEHGVYRDSDELKTTPELASTYNLDEKCKLIADSNATFTSNCHLQELHITTYPCLYTSSSTSLEWSNDADNYITHVNTEYSDINHGYLLEDYLVPIIDDTRFNITLNCEYVLNESTDNRNEIIDEVNNILPDGSHIDNDYILTHKEIILKSSIDREEMLSIRERFKDFNSNIISIDQNVYTYDRLPSLEYRIKECYSHIIGRSSSETYYGYWSYTPVNELFAFDTGDPLHSWMKFTDNVSDETVNTDTIYDEITVNEAPETSVLENDRLYFYYLSADSEKPLTIDESEIDNPNQEKYLANSQWQNIALSQQNKLYALDEPTPYTGGSIPTVFPAYMSQKAEFDPTVMYTMYKIGKNDSDDTPQIKSDQLLLSPGKSYLIGDPYNRDLYLDLNDDTSITESNYVVFKKSNVQRLWFSPNKEDTSVTSKYVTMYNDAGSAIIYYNLYSPDVLDDAPYFNKRSFTYTLDGVYKANGEKITLDPIWEQQLECWLVNNKYNIRFKTKEDENEITDAKFRYTLNNPSYQWVNNGSSPWSALIDSNTNSITGYKAKTNILRETRSELAVSVSYGNLTVDGWSLAESSDLSKFSSSYPGEAQNFNDYVVIKGSKPVQHHLDTTTIATITISRNSSNWSSPTDYYSPNYNYGYQVPTLVGKSTTYGSSYSVHSQSTSSIYGVDGASAEMYIDIYVLDAAKFNSKNFHFLISQSSERNFDYVKVYIDNSDSPVVTSLGLGYQSDSSPVDNDWATVVINELTAGSHRIRIVYSKDGSVTNNNDRGYIAFPTSWDDGRYSINRNTTYIEVTETVQIDEDPEDSYTEIIFTNSTSSDQNVNGIYISSIDEHDETPSDFAKAYLDDSSTPLVTSTDGSWTKITSSGDNLVIPSGSHTLKIHFLKQNEAYEYGFVAIPSSLVNNPSPFNNSILPISGNTMHDVYYPTSTEMHIYGNIYQEQYNYPFKLQVTGSGSASVYLDNIKKGEYTSSDSEVSLSFSLSKTSEWTNQHDIRLVYTSESTDATYNYAEFTIGSYYINTSDSSKPNFDKYEEAVTRTINNGINPASTFKAAYVLYRATMTDVTQDGVPINNLVTLESSNTNYIYFYGSGIIYNRIYGGVTITV